MQLHVKKYPWRAIFMYAWLGKWFWWFRLYYSSCGFDFMNLGLTTLSSPKHYFPRAKQSSYTNMVELGGFFKIKNNHLFLKQKKIRYFLQNCPNWIVTIMIPGNRCKPKCVLWRVSEYIKINCIQKKALQDMKCRCSPSIYLKVLQVCETY